MIIVCCLLGCILGATVLYLVLRPKLQATQELDQETARRNAEIQESNVKLNLELKELSTRKESLTDNIHTLQTYADEYYNKNIELANERFETSIMRVAEDYRAREAEYEQEYLTVLSDTSQAFTETIQQHKSEIFELNTKLTQLRSAVNAAVEAAKRRAEEETQRDFYRLQLSDTDVSEIRKLREVLPYLRDKEPLNKVIYKVYYEKPYTDLIGRVLGAGVKTGIYKITNMENEMCYIGQAVNVADRWKQHIKRGVGAESATRNKLYPVMYELGPENFTFELVEECSRALLDEREDYWQEYFKAKEFGYSIK